MKQLITFNNKNWPLPGVDNLLRFEAVENSTFGLASKAPNLSVQYSFDTNNWTNLTTSSNVSLNAGLKVYIRGKLTGNVSSSNPTMFTMTGKIAAKGNIMYLYNYEHPENKILNYSYCFYNLFRDCKSLITPPELPATTLADLCYSHMFYLCSSLTIAPELPATTLAEGCYGSMFSACTSITSAPELPATALTYYCYYSMFDSCTSLTSSPVLLATTLTYCCYLYMFWGCTSLNKVITYAQNISATDCLTDWLINVSVTGDFYNLGGASYPSGNSGIPSGWRVHTSL